MANTKRIAAGIVVSLCALAVTMADGAAAKREGNNKNSATDQREEWIREVKKLESEPVADGFVKWTGLEILKGTGTNQCETRPQGIGERNQ